MDNKFSIKLIRLDTKVQSLLPCIKNISVKTAEKKLNTINANLEQLFDYAEENNINLGDYHGQIVSIYKSISQLKTYIGRKNRPAWKKLLGIFFGTIDFLARLFGIPLYSIGLIEDKSEKRLPLK